MSKNILLIMLFVLVVSFAEAQETQKPTIIQKQPLQTSKPQVNTGKSSKQLQVEINILLHINDSLRNVNDSLLNVINTWREARFERNELRKIKENNILKFKDPAFEAFLVRYYDKNDDGHISQYEAEDVTKLEITKHKIYSLDGIENFINLEKLVCSKNKLTKLNLTQNTSLRTLICNNNSIAVLDISACQDLITLDCAYNNLTNLALDKNSELKTLNCTNNKLINLDITHSSQLEELNCANNQISTVNIINCTFLRKIECQKNSISRLDISFNPHLEELNCASNKLYHLSVEKNGFLKKLNCASNQLISLNIKNGRNFDFLDCRSNPNLLDVKVAYAQQFKNLKKSRNTVLKIE
jgi:hypothetical protein